MNLGSGDTQNIRRRQPKIKYITVMPVSGPALTTLSSDLLGLVQGTLGPGDRAEGAAETLEVMQIHWFISVVRIRIV